MVVFVDKGEPVDARPVLRGQVQLRVSADVRDVFGG